MYTLNSNKRLIAEELLDIIAGEKISSSFFEFSNSRSISISQNRNTINENKILAR